MRMLHDYHHLSLSQRLPWWFNKFWIRQKNTWLSRQGYLTRLHSTKVMSMFEWSSNIVKIYRGAIGPCQGDDTGSGKWTGLGSIRITHTYNWYSIFDININMSYTRYTYTMTLAFQTQKLVFPIFCYEKLVIFLMKSLWRASKKSPGRATNPKRPRPLQLGGRDSPWHRSGGHGKVKNWSKLEGYGCFQKLGVFPPKWMVKIMEKPIKMDDLGVPLFLETPVSHNWVVATQNFFMFTPTWGNDSHLD